MSIGQIGQRVAALPADLRAEVDTDDDDERPQRIGQAGRYPLRTCRSCVALYQPAVKQRSLTSQKAEVAQSCVPIAADDYLEITPTGPGLSSPVYRRYRCSLQK
jgi:hypothetical protein